MVWSSTFEMTTLNDPLMTIILFETIISEEGKAICTHCNFHGHTIDRCYELRGYPSRYKQKQHSQNISTANTIVNQLFDQPLPYNSSEQYHV